MRIFEFFSGLGSQAIASKKVFKNVEIIGTSEWDLRAILAYYLLNNKYIENNLENSKDELIDFLLKKSLTLNGKTPVSRRTLKAFPYKTLQFLYTAYLKNRNLGNIKNISFKEIPNNIDILTYSFPCQDLSNVGALHGYKNGIERNSNSRSSLLWEIERILIELKKNKKAMPKALLMENVISLLSKRHEKNFEDWKRILNDIGYINKVYIMNSLDFGIPQNRKRVIMLSFYVGKNNSKAIKIGRFLEVYKFKNSATKNLSDFLRTNYKSEIFRKEAESCQPSKTESRLKIWNMNPKIVNSKSEITQNFVPTLTTKQDRHPNSGNLFLTGKKGKSNFRFLTPRECFLLMGFSDNDFDKLKNSNIYTNNYKELFNRDSLYKLAGNSIVINVLEAVFNLVDEVFDNFYLS
jgi:DNA (cytosine-5)-methyltransferase 1